MSLADRLVALSTALGQQVRSLTAGNQVVTGTVVPGSYSWGSQQFKVGRGALYYQTVGSGSTQRLWGFIGVYGDSAADNSKWVPFYSEVESVAGKRRTVTLVKADVNLGNVDNTSDADKPVSTAQSAAISAASAADRARSNHTGTQAQNTIDGLPAALAAKADLVGGLVPSSQLPSYVDDVLEFTNLAAFPATGESGKIYTALDTNRIYRWSGSAYVIISDTIALGETSATAYRGDRGKVAYDHSQITAGNPHGVTKADVGLGNADNTSDANKPVSTAQQNALDGKVANATVGVLADLTTTVKTSIVAAINSLVSRVTALEQDTGWQDITLASGYVAGGTPPQARLLRGVVWMKGNVRPASNAAWGTSQVAVGTLPAGMFPATNFRDTASVNTRPDVGASVFVNTAGSVQMHLETPTGGATNQPAWITTQFLLT